MERFIVKDDKKLRYGYTTGSCAAGAAKAAARMLLGGEEVSVIRLMTPKGFELDLEIEDIQKTETSVSCAVRKDSGDDPDVTNGSLIYAEVSLTEFQSPHDGRDERCQVTIDGGQGVGRVTKPGLDQAVGQAAINSTPRRMITEALVDEMTRAGDRVRALNVVISIPDGEALAQKTFNPKLGIVGGISVLGTTGIVEPMSEKALVDTIKVEINVRKREGYPIIPLAPGNYGQSFMKEAYGFALKTSVETSNFIADSFEMAREAGFKRLLFVGHIGKLVKVAGGVRNTHSRYGDRRMEIMSTIAANQIALMDETDDKKNELTVTIRERLSDCVATDEAIRILSAYGLAEAVMTDMTERVRRQMTDWASSEDDRARDELPQVEVVIFSNIYGELGKTAGAADFMKTITEFQNS